MQPAAPVLPARRPVLPGQPAPSPDALADAWATYQQARRRVWALAPLAERRFFRTQDHAQYTVDRRTILSIVNSGVTAFTAAARRAYGRRATVEPLEPARGGAPSSFLVRVPKPGTLVVHELVFGRPRSAEGRERVRIARTGRRRDGAQDRAQALLEQRYERMVKALAASRWHAAMKQRALTERAVLNLPVRTHLLTPEQQEMRPRYLELARESYHHNREYLRKLRMAQAHRDWLRARGLVYDLNAISTPISLEEGDHGAGPAADPPAG